MAAPQQDQQALQQANQVMDILATLSTEAQKAVLSVLKGYITMMQGVITATSLGAGAAAAIIPGQAQLSEMCLSTSRTTLLSSFNNVLPWCELAGMTHRVPEAATVMQIIEILTMATTAVMHYKMLTTLSGLIDQRLEKLNRPGARP